MFRTALNSLAAQFCDLYFLYSLFSTINFYLFIGVRTLEDASEMLGVMASHEDLCPATLLLNSILSAYAPSSEPDNRYHDKKKQAAYLLRTARVKFTIDLYDVSVAALVGRLPSPLKLIR